jgi:hypothetical protein
MFAGVARRSAMARGLLGDRVMIATRTRSSSPSTLPQAVEALVGDALELVIHSIEAVRDQLGKLVLRRRDTE